MREIYLAHTPPGLAIFAALFTDVKNAPFLRQQLVAGNTDFEYAFIDASMVRLSRPCKIDFHTHTPRKTLSTTHVLASVFKAVNDMLNGRLRSRNVHSEIVFDLSPTNNVSGKRL